MKIIKVLAGVAFLAFCFAHRSHKVTYQCVECDRYMDLPYDLCADCYALYSIEE